MNCEKCGKDMTSVDEDVEQLLVGCHFQLHENTTDSDAIAFAKKQWGKWYNKAKQEGGFGICYECFADVMMNTIKAVELPED